MLIRFVLRDVDNIQVQMSEDELIKLIRALQNGLPFVDVTLSNGKMTMINKRDIIRVEWMPVGNSE